MHSDFIEIVIINGLLSTVISLVIYIAIMKIDRWLDIEAERKKKQKYYDQQTGVYVYQERGKK
jgi:hypothetical protein